ncbi:MAG: response regulator [Deltaproteobacteria bacterium]|nr:response regulator [Deltaproteobacteria bacterium]
MERSRVLVAEDRRSVLQLMRAILGGSHEVLTAEDGRGALALLEAQDLDVVLTDVRLPGAGGFEVLERARVLRPRAQVVLMTAYASIPDAVAAIKAGAYDYLAKPVDADEISLVVARALARANGGAPGGAPTDAGAPLGLSFHGTVEEARHRVSRDYLQALMRLYRGNVTQAALRARMTRESLHRVLRRYQVSPDSHRDAAPGAPPAGPRGAPPAPGRRGSA